MKTLVFYSFKGGVGRSLSLVNTAFHLSHSEGQRVGVVDLDVEACGLSQIFRVGVPEGRDLLTLINPRHRDLTQLEEFVLPLRFGSKAKPRLFLLPCVPDVAQLNQVSWNLATQHFLANELLPAFGRLYELDFLLIDARSGLSESATLALKQGNIEVLTCRLDGQNRYGMKRLVTMCRAVGKPFRVLAVGCPCGYEPYLRRFEKGIGAKVDYVVPYDPRLYFDEFIISKTIPRSRISKIYQTMAQEFCRIDANEGR